MMAQTNGFVCLECGWQGDRPEMVRTDAGLCCPECEVRLF